MTDTVPSTVHEKGPQLAVEKLRNLNSLDDIVDALNDAGVAQITTADDVIGDGFAMLEDKNRLCGVPLIFLTWNFHIGDYGDFVSAKVVTMEGNTVTGRYVLNDGSTGIYQQLTDYTNETGVMGGLAAKHGLRRSDYKYTNEKGQEEPATTYYIDTSA